LLQVTGNKIGYEVKGGTFIQAVESKHVERFFGFESEFLVQIWAKIHIEAKVDQFPTPQTTRLTRRRDSMEVVLLSRKQLIENAIAVHPDLVEAIICSMEPWHRDAALALLVEDALGRAPSN
jgi:hypothetical protein